MDYEEISLCSYQNQTYDGPGQSNGGKHLAIEDGAENKPESSDKLVGTKFYGVGD